MAYNTKKGSQHTGDIQFEGDPLETQIDFENDSITLKTGGAPRLVTNNSHVSASIAISGASFHTLNTVINATHISSSLKISGSGFYAGTGLGSGFYGDGTGLTNAGLIKTYTDPGQYRLLTSVNSETIRAEQRLTFNDYGSGGTFQLRSTSSVLVFSGLTSSHASINATHINPTHVSTSLNVSGSKFYGDGSNLAGVLTASAGSNNQIQYNSAGELNADARFNYYPDLVSNGGLKYGEMVLTGNLRVQGGQGVHAQPDILFVDFLNKSVGINVSSSVRVTTGSSYVYGADFQVSNRENAQVPTIALHKTASSWSPYLEEGDSIGRLVFGGSAAGNFASASAAIIAEVDTHTWTKDSNPSRLEFYTAPSGTAGGIDTQYRRMVINSDGKVGIGIGQTTPNAFLAVSGPAAISITGSSHFDGQVAIGTGSAGSDPEGNPYNLLINSNANSIVSIDAASGSFPYLRFCENGSEISQIYASTPTGAPQARGRLTIENKSDYGTIDFKLMDAGEGETFSVLTLNSWHGAGAGGAMTSSLETRITKDVYVVGNVSASLDISAAAFNGREVVVGGPNLSNSPLYVKSEHDNSVVAIFKSPSNDTIMAMTGSGKVVVGGAGAPYLDGKFNITGSDNEKLLTLKSNTLNPVFYVEGDGDMWLSGNMTIKSNPTSADGPQIHFSSSIDDAVNAHIGMNNANNILIQNNTLNKHIVFKANDGGNIKEGLRLNGQVPEVVVNEGSDSLTNFRVESNINQYMLYVSGATNQVGIGVSDPALGVTLDISGSAMRLRNSSTPASAGAPGVPGEIRWDANYVYICIAIDTWKRAAIATW